MHGIADPDNYNFQIFSISLSRFAEEKRKKESFTENQELPNQLKKAKQEKIKQYWNKSQIISQHKINRVCSNSEKVERICLSVANQ